MNIIIHPHPLSGTVNVPSSKSVAHRLLIASALADAPTEIRLNSVNDDICATAACLSALGAGVERTENGYRITPVRRDTVPDGCELFCGESGSTLRFLIPVAAALGVRCTMTGAGRLPHRPNAVLTDAIRAHGVSADSDLLPMRLSGRLNGGCYALAGNVSSQYITGLLLALPLCPDSSEIVLTTPLESAAYIDITLGILKQFGIEAIPTADGWRIPGGQRYRSPGTVTAEGDWSSAAFWLAANRIGSSIHCTGLNPDSPQGDRAVIALLDSFGEALDVSGTPDLVPVLAAAAALHPGETRFTGAARLRLKESDRLATVAAMLRALGASVSELEDGLVVHGGKAFTGGTVNGSGDHRIVMAAAIAATASQGPVRITDADAVSKSYPDFFDHFRSLGGKAYVESDR